MKKKLCKRMSKTLENLDSKAHYKISEAVNLLKKSTPLLNFDPSIELSVKIGLDLEKLGTSIRGFASLPAGTGQVTKIAVICRDPKKVEEAKNAGADVVGGQELIDEIKGGNINFKVCIATPDMMASIAPIARILGTRGLMPNPKLGTITTKITDTVKQFKSGRIEFKMDKYGFIKTKAGKASFDNDKIESNINAVLSEILKQKPENSKGKYLDCAQISYTMGPALYLKPECLTIAN